MRLLQLRAFLRGEPSPGRGVLRLRSVRASSSLSSATRGPSIGFRRYTLRRLVTRRISVRETIRRRVTARETPAAEDVGVGARARERPAAARSAPSASAVASDRPAPEPAPEAPETDPESSASSRTRRACADSCAVRATSTTRRAPRRARARRTPRIVPDAPGRRPFLASILAILSPPAPLVFVDAPARSASAAASPAPRAERTVPRRLAMTRARVSASVRGSRAPDAANLLRRADRRSYHGAEPAAPS